LFTDQDRKLIVAGEHSLVEIWSVSETGNGPLSMTLETTLDSKSASIFGLCMMQDGRTVFLATSSGIIEMWDLETSRCVKIFSGHTNTVSCVTVTNDGTYLVSGSLDGTVRVWNVSTGDQVSTLYASSEVFTISVIRGADGSNWVLAGLANALILTASLSDTQSKYCIQLHTECVLAVKFGPTGKWFISASKDGTLNCSVIPSGQMICKANESSYVTCCDISACGNYLLSGGGTNAGMVYEVIY
jgi:WD40 repeat protein